MHSGCILTGVFYVPFYSRLRIVCFRSMFYVLYFMFCVLNGWVFYVAIL